MRNPIVMLAVLAPFAALAQTAVKPLALQAAGDYAAQARYPAWSTALEAGSVDPVLDGRTPTRQSRLGPNGAGPRLTVWSSAMNALPGGRVTLYAALNRTAPAGLAGAAAGTAVTGAVVSAELEGRTLGRLGTVAYRDDGVAPDAVANDGVHTGAFTLPAGRAPAPGQADSVMVRVDAVLPGGELRRAAGGLLYSNPSARLTGRFSDSVRDGNLVIAAEVEVVAPGRVHIAGTLADALGAPFATAQAARPLSPGRHRLELTFYGLAFHDRQVSGPVSLASVALTSANGMPNALGPVLEHAHRTGVYAPAAFTARPFGNPELLDSAQRLQLDAAAPALPAAR